MTGIKCLINNPTNYGGLIVVIDLVPLKEQIANQFIPLPDR